MPQFLHNFFIQSRRSPKFLDGGAYNPLPRQRRMSGPGLAPPPPRVSACLHPVSPTPSIVRSSLFLAPPSRRPRWPRIWSDSAGSDSPTSMTSRPMSPKWRPVRTTRWHSRLMAPSPAGDRMRRCNAMFRLGLPMSPRWPGEVPTRSRARWMARSCAGDRTLTASAASPRVSDPSLASLREFITPSRSRWTARSHAGGRTGPASARFLRSSDRSRRSLADSRTRSLSRPMAPSRAGV